MIKKTLKAIGLLSICATLTIGGAKMAMAAENSMGPGFETSTSLILNIDSENVSLYADKSESSNVLAQTAKGNRYEVMENSGDGWVKIKANGSEGYVKLANNASLVEKTQEVEDEAVTKRQEVVQYAMQFLGNRYVYGGNDPHTGVDCSGFTRYVLQNAAGVGMNRSSGSQAAQGRSVSADEMQPGDLVFYGNGSRINHVGLYIGNGQIVHASTERTGIKISDWTYRQPVKIVNVIG